MPISSGSKSQRILVIMLPSLYDTCLAPLGFISALQEGTIFTDAEYDRSAGNAPVAPMPDTDGRIRILVVATSRLSSLVLLSKRAIVMLVG